MQNPPGDNASWRVDQLTVTEETRTAESYSVSKRGNVTFTIGEKGDADRYENGQLNKPTFVGLMETFFKIPNSQNMKKQVQT